MRAGRWWGALDRIVVPKIKNSSPVNSQQTDGACEIEKKATESLSTTSRRASTGFLAGKKYLFFASDGTFERSVSMINH